MGRRSLFRVERWARLMTDTLNHYDGAGYQLHAYVIMPDHLHLLITPTESVEKSVQLIKGGFSFRAKRELEWNGEIWQPGFTDHRIRDEEDWRKHLAYIQNNPVDAHLTSDSVHYEFMGLPSIAFPRGLKPALVGDLNVRAEARTLQPEARTLQPEARTLQPEARTFQPESSLISSGTAEAVPFQDNSTSSSNNSKSSYSNSKSNENSNGSRNCANLI
jgi:putative transposase